MLEFSEKKRVVVLMVFGYGDGIRLHQQMCQP